MMPRDLWPSPGDRPSRPAIRRPPATRAGRWIAGLSPAGRAGLAAAVLAVLLASRALLAPLGLAAPAAGLLDVLGPGGLAALLCGALLAWVVYLNLR